MNQTRSFSRTTVALAVSALTLAAGLVFQISPAGAATFAQATRIAGPPNAGVVEAGDYFAVSCASPGNCTGVGTYGDNSGRQQLVAATESAGVWSQATGVTAPSNAATNPTADLLGVSCWSPLNCVAVGGYTDNSAHTVALAAIETAGSWAQAVEITPPGNAMANPGAELLGVSCNSASNCDAVGRYAIGVGQEQIMVTSLTGGTWASATEVPAPADAGTAGAGAAAVSCASFGNCTAAGNYTDTGGNSQILVATEASGTWSQASGVAAPADAQANPGTLVRSISCSSTSECSLAGNYTDNTGHIEGMAATETSGSWAQAVRVAPPADAAASPVAELLSVSCTSPGECVAVGMYLANDSSRQAMVATATSGAWGQATRVAAPSDANATNPTAQLQGVSCASAGSCSAVGVYLDTSLHVQGMGTGMGSVGPAPSSGGYRLVGADGTVHSFNAPDDGSLPALGVHVNNIVGMASDLATGGYWLVGADGGVFGFNAPYEGSLPALGVHVNNIVGMAVDAATGGYWLVGADGGVFGFNAPYEGSLPGLGVVLNNIVGMAVDTATGGYWLVGADGGVFGFNAPYEGSLPGLGVHVNNTVGIAAA